VTEFNESFSGREPHQDVKVWYHPNWSHQFCCYQTTSTTWRWGRSYFQQRRKTFASWRDRLPENVSL